MSNGRKVRDSGLYRAVFHPGDAFKQSEAYRSAIRHPSSSTARGRSMQSFQNFFLHVYPVKVSRDVLKTRTTLRLGFIATVLFAILFISGMYLMFFYRPSVPDAFFNMHTLATSVAFGQFVRNIHRWSAHLMVVVVFIHLMRVFYTGAYRAPRQFNWVVGVSLLLLTLLMSFTGYLLPWDQLAYWAITVGTNIAGYVPLLGTHVHTILLGGTDVTGDNTPALLRPAHLPDPGADGAGARRSTSGACERTGSRSTTGARRRAAASAPGRSPLRASRPVRRRPMASDQEPRYRLLGIVPREVEQKDEQEPDDSVFAWPHFLVRHVVVAGATIAIVFVLAILFDAPLKDIANPAQTPPVAKAPWYFAGLQELLAHFSADGRGRARTGRRGGLPGDLPYLDRGTGWRARDRKPVVVLFTVLALAALVLTVIGACFRGPEWSWVWPWHHLYVEL